MPLDPLQEQIVRTALALPEARSLALAGGGAMLAHRFVDRTTKDVDLFTDRDVAEALAVVPALRTALERQGLVISESPLPPQEHRFVVADPSSGLECAVDVFADGGRIRDRVLLDIGPALHPDDLVADKVLALWARARPRDFVDVAALVKRFGPDRLMQLASEKDSGFTIETFVDALTAMRRLKPRDWERDDVRPDTAAATQRVFEGWLRWLQDPAPREEPRRGFSPGPAPLRPEPPGIER